MSAFCLPARLSSAPSFASRPVPPQASGCSTQALRTRVRAPGLRCPFPPPTPSASRLERFLDPELLVTNLGGSASECLVGCDCEHTCCQRFSKGANLAFILPQQTRLVQVFIHSGNVSDLLGSRGKAQSRERLRAAPAIRRDGGDERCQAVRSQRRLQQPSHFRVPVWDVAPVAGKCSDDVPERRKRAAAGGSQPEGIPGTAVGGLTC